jgi:hypothetical protein
MSKEVIVAENGKLLIRAEVNGVQITVAKRDLENEDFTDPNFFDDDWRYLMRSTTRGN